MFAKRRLKILFFAALLFLGVAALVRAIIWSYVGEVERRNVLTAGGQPELVVMDFSEPIPLDPLPDGWRHREFWTRRPMEISFAVKEGRPAIRLATEDSASMLFRHLDVDLAEYPTLAWQWYVEKPIESPLDERTFGRRRSPGAAVHRVSDGRGRQARHGNHLGQPPSRR